MAETKILPRKEIPEKYTWNAPNVFPSKEAWETALKELPNLVTGVTKYQGHLGDSTKSLLEAMQAYNVLYSQVGRIFVYASMSQAVDTMDQESTRMTGKAQSAFAQAIGAISYLDPELLTIGPEKLHQWMEAEPGLSIYAHYFDDLFRRQSHVRSPEVEELLGILMDPFRNVGNTANMLTNADFKFPSARSSDGSQVPLTNSTYDTILSSPDRESRRTAYENYTGVYLGYKNTLASNLISSVKANVFMMRARRHVTTLEASLFENHIPVEVFHNLIDTYRKNLPTWHRYWAIRRKALRVDKLQPYDIWAPLTQKRPQLSYEETVDWICKGLAPMGAEYVNTVRQGCLVDRWVDWMPNQGKTDGAFSSGWPGTFPFILMSFDGTIFRLSTLAHELGHSMHSYLTWQNQPLVYSSYSLFVAEVASNFHQAMVRAYLLDHSTDPDFQISVIEEAMSNFHRYFFIMPTLARFELEIHMREEHGEGLSADDMIALMADLFAEGYGNEMKFDRQQVGITWATFGHLYMDYYVYQYSTGISGANALSRRILNGTPGAVQDYLGFLKAGGSQYPLDILKKAGVDLTTSQPVEDTFAILAGLIERLEKLVEQKQKAGITL
jgi:oligoendopeptidase F